MTGADPRCPCDVCKRIRRERAAARAELAAYRHRNARAWGRGESAGLGAYRVKTQPSSA